MPVVCAKCGEELLGSVNRCWKCGQLAISTPDSAGAPPVRRSPVVLKAAEDAESTSDEVFIASLGQERDAAIGSVDNSETGGAETDAEAVDDSSESPETESSPSNEETEENSRTDVDATRPFANPSFVQSLREFGLKNWLSVAAVILGLLAMGLGWLTPWMVLVAGCGLGCGIVGLTSNRKTLAFVGLLLCLMGVTISSVRLAYDTYEFIRGEAISPIEPLPGDDFGDPFDSMEPLE